MVNLRPTLPLVVAALLLAACSSAEPLAEPTARTSSSAPSLTTPPAAPSPSGTPTPKPRLSRLKRADVNAIAFAPLSDPDDVTLVGSVPSARAWSTSKVLVMLAFIQQVAGGDPGRLTPDQRDLIELALTESDLDALLTLRSQIPGGSGAPATAMLRALGDKSTTVPDVGEGSMQWSLRNQLKFLAALHEGEVVSKAASRYVLANMHPVKSESWGLGTIGASAFKGGWLEPSTETRQMGYVDGYAVAIITYADGPAVLQIDGDYAHVQQLNHLAKILRKHLAADRVERAG